VTEAYFILMMMMWMMIVMINKWRQHKFVATPVLRSLHCMR